MDFSEEVKKGFRKNKRYCWVGRIEILIVIVVIILTELLTASCSERIKNASEQVRERYAGSIVVPPAKAGTTKYMVVDPKTHSVRAVTCGNRWGWRGNVVYVCSDVPVAKY